MKKQTQWQQHVKAWREMGMCLADYCRQQSLNAKPFSVWVLRCQLKSSMDKNAPLEIIPVQLAPSVPDAPAQACMMLRLPHSEELELSAAVSPRWLAELLQCLS
ncbi:MAG: hypothetical protein PHO08_16945 [Methylococcales bacterium]|nr:hypothetical protein [Methylococcales bacterium]MDD5632546.1 hypothetical protein [Methylococcales bacterium]